MASRRKAKQISRGLAWSRVLYFANRKPNDIFTEADPDVPIRYPSHRAHGASQNVSGRLKCCLQADLMSLKIYHRHSIEAFFD
jgi:hypothetical protein